MMKAWYAVFALMACAVALTLSSPPPAASQSTQIKDDVERLAVDLHAGMDRSTLTEQQKAKLRDDFRELRRAHENHERFAAMGASRSIRTTIDSGAFKPEDRQRIEQDMQAIRQAREGEGGGVGEGGLGMRRGRFGRFRSIMKANSARLMIPSRTLFSVFAHECTVLLLALLRVCRPGASARGR
jgi:hypothetical protein